MLLPKSERYSSLWQACDKRRGGMDAAQYKRVAPDKTRLGEIIGLIATIAIGDEKSRRQGILGRHRSHQAGL